MVSAQPLPDLQGPRAAPWGRSRAFLCLPLLYAHSDGCGTASCPSLLQDAHVGVPGPAHHLLGPQPLCHQVLHAPGLVRAAFVPMAQLPVFTCRHSSCVTGPTGGISSPGQGWKGGSPNKALTASKQSGKATSRSHRAITEQKPHLPQPQV